MRRCVVSDGSMRVAAVAAAATFPSLLTCKEPTGHPAVCCWCPRLA